MERTEINSSRSGYSLLRRSRPKLQAFLGNLKGRIRLVEASTLLGSAAVGLALCVYWVLFFLWPLRSLPASESWVWRRIYLLSWLLLPEELIALWFGEPPRFALLDRIPLFGIAAVIWLWAFSWGWMVLGALRVRDYLHLAERIVFSLGLGVALISLFMLVVGLAGLLRETCLLWGVVLLSFILWGVSEGIRIRRGRYFHRQAKPDISEGGGPQGVVHQGGSSALSAFERVLGEGPLWKWALLLSFCLVIVLGAVLPPVEFDVREYHLQAPKEFFQQGRIFFVPHNVYANMPLGAEMLVLAAMTLLGDWWAGALAGKLAQSGFTFLIAAGLLAVGGRMGIRGVGLTAALLFLSTPWVVQIANLGLVEWSWGAYAFLAWYAWILWTISKEAEGGTASRKVCFSGLCPGRTGLLFVSGLFAGAAAGCKYPAVPLVVIPLAAATVSCLLLRRTFRKLLELSSPGNLKLGGGSMPSVSNSAERTEDSRFGRDRAKRFSPCWKEAFIGGQACRESPPEQNREMFFAGVALAILVLGMLLGGGLWYGKNAWLTGNPVYPLLGNLLDGKTRTPELIERWSRAHRPPGFSVAELVQDCLRILWGSEWLSPLIWPFVFLGWRRVPVALRWLALCVVAWWFGVWWLATHRIDRFWLPVLPGLALLGGFAGISKDQSDRRLATYALMLGTGWNLFICSTVGGGYPHFFVPLRQLKEDPARLSPWVTYLNQDPEVSTVLLVGEAAVFDYQVPVLYNTCFDPCLLENLAAGREPEEFRRVLHDRGISHILVHWAEIARYRSPGNYGFCQFVSEELFELWEKAGILEPIPQFVNPPVVIYRVR